MFFIGKALAASNVRLNEAATMMEQIKASHEVDIRRIGVKLIETNNPNDLPAMLLQWEALTKTLSIEREQRALRDLLRPEQGEPTAELIPKPKFR